MKVTHKVPFLYSFAMRAERVWVQALNIYAKQSEKKSTEDAFCFNMKEYARGGSADFLKRPLM